MYTHPVSSNFRVVGVSCSAEMSHILLLLLLTFETAASEGESLNKQRSWQSAKRCDSRFLGKFFFFLNSCSNVIINSSVFAASSHLKIVTVARLMVNKIKCERDDKHIFEIHCCSLNLQICSETKAKLRFLYLI